MPRKKKVKPIVIKEDLPPEPSEESFEFILPEGEVGEQNAPFWRRAVAYVIDVFIFYFTFFQIFIAIYLPKVGFNLEEVDLVEQYVAASPDAALRLFVGLVVASFVLLFYFMILEVSFGTTIGKKLMGLRVSGKLNYINTFLRNLTKSVFVFLLPIDIIGIFLYGRRFTESLSKTKVIYHNKLSVEYGVWY
ncbi:MAG: RDD family protein [Nanoarchaeota archaeon]|nr:RDD family protein [Nanoarchaeota archaeon]